MVLSRTFIANQTCFRNPEKSQISNLILCLNEVEKEEQNPRLVEVKKKKKEIIKIRTKINEKETKNTIEKTK